MTATADELGRDAAAALRQCHDETGIDLTDWQPVRALVEAYTGPLHPEDRAEHAARTYLVGLPVAVTVYPDGRVLLEVDASEAGVGILDDEETVTDDTLDQALDDRATIDAAHDARRISAIVTRPRGD